MATRRNESRVPTGGYQWSLRSRRFQILLQLPLLLKLDQLLHGLDVQVRLGLLELVISLDDLLLAGHRIVFGLAALELRSNRTGDVGGEEDAAGLRDGLGFHPGEVAFAGGDFDVGALFGEAHEDGCRDVSALGFGVFAEGGDRLEGDLLGDFVVGLLGSRPGREGNEENQRFRAVSTRCIVSSVFTSRRSILRR